MPGASGCGVSKRLDDAERERLRSLANALKPAGAGLIVRTAAEGVAQTAIERDLQFLRRVWGGVERRVATAVAPALVYRESELAIRVVRDLLGPHFVEVAVDDQELHRRLRNYVKAVTPDMTERVVYQDGTRALFDQKGIEAEARRALRGRGEL